MLVSGVIALVASTVTLGWLAFRDTPERVRDTALDAIQKRDWHELYRVSLESTPYAKGWTEERFVGFLTALDGGSEPTWTAIAAKEYTQVEPQETRRGYGIELRENNGPGKHEVIVHALRDRGHWRVQGAMLAMSFLKHACRKGERFTPREVAEALKSSGIDVASDPMSHQVLSRDYLEEVVASGKNVPTVWSPDVKL